MPQPTAATVQPGTPAEPAPTASQMYEAARLARRELRNQQSELLSQRQQLQRELQAATNAADIKGLEGRLAAIDQRIGDVEKQLASADALVATRAAVPGVVVDPPRSQPDVEDIVGMSMAFSLVLLFPMSVAYARRIWRRSAAPRELPQEFHDRMSNLERGVEAVAIEVERLGEGQRFVTQLLSESDRRRQALPAEHHPGQEL